MGTLGGKCLGEVTVVHSGSNKSADTRQEIPGNRNVILEALARNEWDWLSPAKICDVMMRWVLTAWLPISSDWLYIMYHGCCFFAYIEV